MPIIAKIPKREFTSYHDLIKMPSSQMSLRTGREQTSSTNTRRKSSPSRSPTRSLSRKSSRTSSPKKEKSNTSNISRDPNDSSSKTDTLSRNLEIEQRNLKIEIRNLKNQINQLEHEKEENAAYQEYRIEKAEFIIEQLYGRMKELSSRTFINNAITLSKPESCQDLIDFTDKTDQNQNPGSPSKIEFPVSSTQVNNQVSYIGTSDSNSNNQVSTSNLRQMLNLKRQIAHEKRYKNAEMSDSEMSSPQFWANFAVAFGCWYVVFQTVFRNLKEDLF